jgi:hypothetical protein
VRHFWINKDLVARSLADSVMQYFLPRLHQLYMSQASEHIIDAKGFKLDGADLIELSAAEKEAAKKEAGKNQKDEGY